MGYKQYAVLALLCVTAAGCMKWEEGRPDGFDNTGDGLFILCEGNFQYGNATLSYYNPADGKVENEVFYRANGMRLGDVAQSMTMYDGKGWIVVNNSHVIFAIDPVTCKEAGRIENLTSPRHILFINSEKAYVSQLWDNRIYIINPTKYEITGYIEVPGMQPGNGSTEQMAMVGDYVYCTCWSYQNRVIRIDPSTDKVTGSIEVGLQPKALVKDCHDRLWTITDGGFEGSPYGYEQPRLICIDPSTFSIIRTLTFREGAAPTGLTANGDGTSLYWIDDDVWEMSADAVSLPAKPLIESRKTRYFALTVNPANSDIYLADAIDYMQQGKVYHYSASGTLLEDFYVGVTPGAFCWK